jgi:hypothetical protein
MLESMDTSDVGYLASDLSWDETLMSKLHFLQDEAAHSDNDPRVLDPDNQDSNHGAEGTASESDDDESTTAAEDTDARTTRELTLNMFVSFVQYEPPPPRGAGLLNMS